MGFGDQIAFEDTLQGALDVLFGGDSGANAGDGGTEVTPTPAPTGSAEPGDGGATDGGSGTGTDVAFQAALQEAQQAMLDRQAALTAGDWTKYGEADARLTAAVEKLLQLSGD